MKNIFISIALMVFANLAYAQVSAHQKMTSTVVNTPSSNQANTPNAASVIPNTPQKMGSATSAPIQQGNKTTSPQTTSGSQGRRVCRTVGSTVYYCL